jgi:hypothetical protein
MHDRRPEIDPYHKVIQGLLRVLGPALAILGLVLTAVGFVSFFRSFGTFEPPRYFICAIIGLPLLGVGLALSRFAFLGMIGRYIAGEVAPVGKDALNYMAKEASPGVEVIARAAAKGFAQGAGTAEGVPCPRCESPNDAASRYCAQCGGPLQEATCPGCGRGNDPGANFCSQCGARLNDDGR